MPANVAFLKSSFVSTSAGMRDWKTGERQMEHSRLKMQKQWETVRETWARILTSESR